MDVVVEWAGRDDDSGIRQLLRRQTMPGRIRLRLEREPEFALGCVPSGDDVRIAVARSLSDGRVVGVAYRTVRHVFINGRRQRLGYLGHLRVDDEFRGRWLLARGFALLRDAELADPLPAYLAAIVDGNDEAMGVLVDRRRRSFPEFREVARYRTLALPLGRAKRTLPGPEEIVPGSVQQLPELVHFLQREGANRQLSTVWTADLLGRFGALGLRLEDFRIARRRGEIVGVMALWDQSAYKQTVVHGYSGWLKAAAPLLRMPLPTLWPPLPKLGETIRSAYASLVCIAGGSAPPPRPSASSDDANRVFARLLRELYNLAGARRFAYLLVGLDARDPLMAAAAPFRHISYPSRLYLASWTGRVPHEQLDSRPVYVDIATL